MVLPKNVVLWLTAVFILLKLSLIKQLDHLGSLGQQFVFSQRNSNTYLVFEIFKTKQYCWSISPTSDCQSSWWRWCHVRWRSAACAAQCGACGTQTSDCKCQCQPGWTGVACNGRLLLGYIYLSFFLRNMWHVYTARFSSVVLTESDAALNCDVFPASMR